MKKALLPGILLSLVLLITSCSGDTPDGSNPTNSSGTTSPTTQTTTEEDPQQQEEDEIPIRHMQDTPILHCFNWKMVNIQNNLAEIKDAGFKTIQISPMQPQKDPYDGPWQNQWWKLYQPYGFSISKSYDENKLGDKAALTSLCTAANAMGIDIIVDVVSNHLAGGNPSSFDSKVKDFEPEIYNQYLIHNLGRGVDDNDLEALLRGNLGGYPDLKTESPVVQQRVLSLLKEYLDCGIHGFRFDAAKHIETPDDGEYASQFWPTVLGGATEYAKQKGYPNPYYYGEILYTPGRGRSIEQYTKYMSVTDSNASSGLLDAVASKTVDDLNPSFIAPHSKTVLWPESHDTYSNDSHETTYVPTGTINDTYVVEATMKGVSTLYLSRPQGNLGDVGEKRYLDNDVIAANKFHNICANLQQEINIQNGFYINQRSDKAIAILRYQGAFNDFMEFPTLKDGTYINLFNKATTQITNHRLMMNTITDGVLLVEQEFYNKMNQEAPTIKVGNYSEIYSGTQDISLTISNAKTISCSIDGNSYQIENSIIHLPSTIPNKQFKVRIEASNDVGGTVVEFSLLKVASSLLNKTIYILNINNSYKNMIWAWKDSNGGAWYDPTIDNDMIGAYLNDCNNFLIARFTDLNTNKDNANWSNVYSQSQNIHIEKQIYNYSEFNF